MIDDAADRRRVRAAILLSSAVAWALVFTLPEHACHGIRGASPSLDAYSLGSTASSWLLMTVAMMLPSTLPALYAIRATSFESLRWWVTTLFVGAYALVWIIVGGILDTLVIIANRNVAGFAPAAAALGAVLWHASPMKQMCLNRCHRHSPVAAFGLEAARDAVVVGASHGLWCAGACGPVMLLVVLLPDGLHLPAMACLTPVIFLERFEPPVPPAWSLRLRGLRSALSWLRPDPGREAESPSAASR